MKSLLTLSLLVLTCLFGSCELFEEAQKGCTDPYSFNYDPNAEESDGSCREMYGCLGYAGNMSNSGSLGVTLNDPYYDQKMNEEVYIQRNFFGGIPANVFILYEPGPEYKNAYASPDGQILFGYYMFYYTVANYGELPVAGILAHEWGHRAQFTIGWNDYHQNAHRELEADAFSGFYMALAKQWAWSQIEGYYANVYATGDYNFNHPSHHGTPDQRLQAAYFGVQVAVYALQNNIQYSYNDLHNIFNTEIQNNIDPRTTAPEFAEVQYPEGLTQEYIRSLFPRMK